MRLVGKLAFVALVFLTGVCSSVYLGNTGTPTWNYNEDSAASGFPLAYFYYYWTYTHNLNIVGTQKITITPVGDASGSFLYLGSNTANSFTVWIGVICNTGIQPSGTYSAAQNSCDNLPTFTINYRIDT